MQRLNSGARALGSCCRLGEDAENLPAFEPGDYTTISLRRPD
jgi:hypothetical protein